MKQIFLLTIITFLVHIAQAQVTIEYLDINNVKAGILNRGDLFGNPATGNSIYEFPKGSGKHSNSTSALWISGFDNSTAALKVSAQTYRQSGNDYWSGPLDQNNSYTIDSITSEKWDRIWKVNKTTIDSFLQIGLHTVFNTPPSILEWPAKGNPYAIGKNNSSLNITRDMAPFYDVNQDGLYNAVDGDYPKIKGEQMLWWVFNDMCPHTESGGMPIGVEVHASAYACNSLPELQNMTFYNYEINYFGTSTLNNTRFTIFDDIDVGYAFNDYIGCDTTRRMAIGYNGSSYDGIYGTNLTQTGVLILKTPNNNGPMGACTFYNNSTNVPTGNPTIAENYHNYCRAQWLDGKPFTNACNARDSIGFNPINYVYPDEPNVNGWSEKQCNNTPGDRRFLLSTSDFNMIPGSSPYEFNFAVINTPLGSSNTDFSLLKSMADTAQIYADGCGSPSFPTSLASTELANSISVFPNPAYDFLQITFGKKPIIDSRITIMNSMGQVMISQNINSSQSVDISDLKNALYFIKINSDGNVITKQFLKL